MAARRLVSRRGQNWQCKMPPRRPRGFAPRDYMPLSLGKIFGYYGHKLIPLERLAG